AAHADAAPYPSAVAHAPADATLCRPANAGRHAERAARRDRAPEAAAHPDEGPEHAAPDPDQHADSHAHAEPCRADADVHALPLADAKHHAVWRGADQHTRADWLRRAARLAGVRHPARRYAVRAGAARGH